MPLGLRLEMRGDSKLPLCIEQPSNLATFVCEQLLHSWVMFKIFVKML